MKTIDEAQIEAISLGDSGSSPAQGLHPIFQSLRSLTMFTSVTRITGMTKFKGEIEGKLFDSTKVLVELKMDARDGNRRGSCTMEFNAGKSNVYDELAHIPLPADFEVEWATVTNGSKSRQIIESIKPVKSAAVPPGKVS